MPGFTFARGNATKLLSLPLYALGRLASIVVRRRDDRWAFASGSGLGEGALALYRHAREADPALRLTWVARDRAERDRARDLGMTAVLRSSWRGFRVTLRSRIVVVTHGLGDANRFGMHGAFVVQLWHGIPLKKIQLDSPVTFGGRRSPRRLLRALYRRSASTIRLVTAASEVSATRLRSAFGLPSERVVVTGDPRDDIVLGPRDAAHDLLVSHIGAIGDDRVILFAPTWRDGDVDPVVPTDDEWAAIAEHLEASSSVLVIRPHPHSVGEYGAGAAVSGRIRMLRAADLHGLGSGHGLGSEHGLGDINPVLPAVDILVTDYSSIAFDFALLGRPIAFLAPDVAAYTASRGLYEPYRDFSGGTHVGTWRELLDLLADSHALQALSAHATALASSHHAFHDGHNTARAFAAIRERQEKRS